MRSESQLRDATTEELSEAVFSVRSVPRLYNDETLTLIRREAVSRVEAGSNTSTVALRVVGGDEKGTQCLGVELGHPIPGGYKYGDLALRLGESRI
jgi:hypothetical protein